MRTLTEIDADIAATQQRQIQPQTDLSLDPTGDRGIGLPALNLLNSLNATIATLRSERAEVVAGGPYPKDLSKLEFQAYLLGIVGMSAYQAFRTDPLLFVLNDTLNLAVVIRAVDVTEMLPAVVITGHITQEQSDAIIAGWPAA
ncbi:MAG: hypothetical protein WCO00_06160 [Rhodospirillaceae bacterium]